MSLKVPTGYSICKELREMSLAIIIVGAQLGIYLNILVVNWNWNNILMLVAMLFLPNWRNLVTFKFPAMSKHLLWLSILFLFIWLHILYRPLPSYNLNLLAYVSVTVFCVASLQNGDISLNSVIKKVWVMSFICAIVGMYLHSSGIFIDMKEGGNHDIAEIANMSSLVLGNGCCVGIASGLGLTIKNKVKFCLIVVSIVFELVVIVLIGKRTPLMCALIMLVIYAIIMRKINLTRLLPIICGLCILVTVGLFIADSQFHITNQFGELFEYTQKGIHDMLNGTTTSGNISARYRYRYFNNGIHYIANNFSWFNYIWGGGIMIANLTDVPLLESFVDLGLIGLCGYAFYVIVFPLLSIFKYGADFRPILFAGFLAMYNIVSCMNSGHPYSMGKWWPAIFLSYTLVCYKHQQIKPIK